MAKTDPIRWLKQHGDVLFRFAMARCGGDKALSEDLVQETLLAALKAQQRFTGLSSERTWLVGILKHKIADHWRKAGLSLPRLETSSEDQLESAGFDANGHWTNGPKPWTSDPGKELDNKELATILECCLDELPERLRTVFVMREVDHIPSSVLRKELEISPTNYWVMMHRARNLLRACMERRWLGKGDR